MESQKNRCSRTPPVRVLVRKGGIAGHILIEGTEGGI